MTGFALDPTDLRLLDLLQHDASLSNQDLAAAAHVSPATCLRRVGGAPYLHTLISTVPTAANAGYYATIVSEKAILRRLVEAGVIERRVALLSHERLGHGLTAIVEITLDRQGAEHLAAFEQRAVADAAVQQCYRVSPGPDFVLVVWAADMPAYQALVQRLFTQDANVRQVKAYFSVQRAKFQPAIGLSGLPGASQARASSASPVR